MSTHSIPLLFARVLLGCALSAPTIACMCSCEVLSREDKAAAAAQVASPTYVEIFSGLVLSTDRIDEPVRVVQAVSGSNVIEDPGHWMRSRVLVLRVWRGTPSTVAEVWTPVSSDCDTPPIPGFNFVALVKKEKGRSVAANAYCDCARQDAAREGHGKFTVAGIALIAAAVGAGVLVLLWFGKLVRRRGRSR